MINHFNIFLFILFLLSFVGCSTTRYVPVKETEKEVVNYKDSIQIRDSIVVIPVERTDTVYVEKPVPYEVEKRVRYVPSFFKFTALFFVGVILLIIIRIVLKYKGL